MEAGEKELRQAYEETTTKNVRSVIEHSNMTRKMVREVKIQLQAMENNFLNQIAQIDAIRSQVAMLLTKIYSGGTTSGDNDNIP